MLPFSNALFRENRRGDFKQTSTFFHFVSLWRYVNSHPEGSVFTVMQYIFFSLLQLGGVQRGKVDIQLVGNDDFKCKYLSFSSSFSGGTPVQVFASTNHGNRSSGVHDSAFIWVEDLSTTRFKICLVQGGKGYGDNITIDWFAFQGSQAGVYHGQASFSLFTTGSKCERLTFSQVRSLYVYSCNSSSSFPPFFLRFLPSFFFPSFLPFSHS